MLGAGCYHKQDKLPRNYFEKRDDSCELLVPGDDFSVKTITKHKISLNIVTVLNSHPYFEVFKSLKAHQFSLTSILFC